MGISHNFSNYRAVADKEIRFLIAYIFILSDGFLIHIVRTNNNILGIGYEIKNIN